MRVQRLKCKSVDKKSQTPTEEVHKGSECFVDNFVSTLKIE